MSTNPTPPTLEGIRVLDLASVGPGARASRILSDYGADVVKIGPVSRSGAVQIRPPFHAYSGNRLMRRAEFDLKSPGGRSAFMDLAAGSDVIIESFRPGVVDRLGIGHHAVNSVNDGIIYCSTSGFGQTGPRSTWAGHDLNYLALSGYLHCSGRDGNGVPTLPGATVADIAAGGMHAAMAIMSALFGRARGGRGQYLDVSIADGAFAMMSLFVDEHLVTGTEPGPGHYILTGRYACYSIYACSDGRHVSVAAIEPSFWRNLCEALGLERFIDSQLDDSMQDEIRRELKRVFAGRDRDTWAEMLGPENCCVAPVLSISDAVTDPHFVEHAVVVDATHPDHGSFRQTAPIWAGTTHVPENGYRLPDASTTDTRDLLTEVGYSESTIDNLIRNGAVA